MHSTRAGAGKRTGLDTRSVHAVHQGGGMHAHRGGAGALLEASRAAPAALERAPGRQDVVLRARRAAEVLLHQAGGLPRLQPPPLPPAALGCSPSTHHAQSWSTWSRGGAGQQDLGTSRRYANGPGVGKSLPILRMLAVDVQDGHGRLHLARSAAKACCFHDGC